MTNPACYTNPTFIQAEFVELRCQLKIISESLTAIIRKLEQQTNYSLAEMQRDIQLLQDKVRKEKTLSPDIS